MALFGFKRRAEPDGLPVATDELSSKYYQLMKLVLGPLGTDGGPVSSSNPLPVAEGTLTYTKTRPTIPSGTSTEVIAANTARKEVTIINNNVSTPVMFHLEIGAAAVADQCLRLRPGEERLFRTTQAINAIQSSGGPLSLEVYEGT